MDTKQQHDLQKQIITYFESHDDATLVAFIELFVYHKGTKNTEISKLVEKFLVDNGLNDAYMNYIMDSREGDDKPLFKRSSFSQRIMIDAVSSALMNAAFNRLRRLV
jgi:hypothetical protein